MELNFNNTETAFRSKSNRDLNRALWLFRSLASPRLVKTATWMTNVALRLKLPVNWLIKPTIYRHFVGGETLEECAGTVARHKEFGVGSVLDYSVEGSHDDKSIQETLLETLKSIRNAAGESGIPFAVFKPTAFAVPELFENAEPGRPLEGQMENEYYRFRSRVNVLCNEAFKLDVPLMIDAEDSWYQHLVDDTTEEMMRRYNREKAIVFNTLQMYRHDRIQFLKDSIVNAREGNYFLGVKLVRGAYMEKERERAKAKGYPSPICPDKGATDAAFDEALRISLDNSDIVSVFCGSHNETSNLLMAQEILKRELPLNDNRFWFAQLYGMSDHISFNLANKGFNVAKYVPYGPVKNVMPYLFRRAEENTSIAGQTGRELKLLKTEIRRRKNNH